MTSSDNSHHLNSFVVFCNFDDICIMSLLFLHKNIHILILYKYIVYKHSGMKIWMIYDKMKHSVFRKNRSIHHFHLFLLLLLFRIGGINSSSELSLS